MLGKGEREVRYETLVQGILKREDAAVRRVVCLSALFPNPEDMEDLVGWIRQDEEGESIHSTWRPTRQRFGTIESNSYGGGRLEISLGEEQPFVPRFVEKVSPPERQGRYTDFPKNNHELTIAAAWRFISQGKKVLVYCSMKKSVEGFGKEILDLLKRGFIEPLVEDSEALRNARSVGVEWLGGDHPAVLCLEYGVALHHAGLPRQFLNEVEELLKACACPLTVASPTLAQGLNLSASVLLVPSIWRNREIIPTAEFANVAGRAGRAFVDLEGLILHVVWDQKPKRKKEWVKLVEEAKAPLLESGIWLLTIEVLIRIAIVNKVEVMEVIDYVTGNSEVWDYAVLEGEVNPPSIEDWDRNLASLDAALLGMMELDCEVSEIPSVIDKSLEGSLFSRQATKMEEAQLDVVLKLLAERAGLIWASTTEEQRRGFYFAGIGLKTGLLVSAELENLLSYLFYAEKAIDDGDPNTASDLIIRFAEIVFQFAPFQTYKELPENWQTGLGMWLSGESSSEVIKLCGSDGVGFLQDGIGYRLPWAMEAVRVHCVAIGRVEEGQLSGLSAIAVEVGSLKKEVMTLIRNGLSSREAAELATTSTIASFEGFDGMMEWLESPLVMQSSLQEIWPSKLSRYSWLKFYEREKEVALKVWQRESLQVELFWLDESIRAGEQVILRHSEQCSVGCQVLTPDYKIIGETSHELNIVGVFRVWVDDSRAGLFVEYFR